MERIDVVKKIYIIVSVVVIVALCAALSVITDQLNNAGNISDRYRESLQLTESTNRELASTIGECRRIADQLTETNNRAITTARDAIEVIEQLRIEVQELENCLGSFDWDIYYQYWDNEFGINN